MKIQPLLSVQEIEKIKAEELLRQQLRNELAPKESEKRKILIFLNTALGIWLLSTVTVGLITWGYSQWRDSKRSAAERETLILQIDLEMSNRITDFESALYKSENYADYSSAVYGFLKSGSLGKHERAQTILNEYEDVSTRSLLITLSQIVNDKDRQAIRDVILGVNKIDFIFKRRGDLSGVETKLPLDSAMQREKDGIFNVFNKIKLTRWQITESNNSKT